MSLVNEILKNLSKRQKHPVKPEIVFSGLQPVHNSEKSMHKKINPFILFFAIVITCTTAGVFFPEKIMHLFHKNLRTVPDSVLVSAQQASVSTAEKFLSPVNHPAILTAITLQLQRDTTCLRFLLTENALYRVFSDEHNNHLVITIDNAHLSAAAPLLNYKNSALQDIKIFNNGSDVKIILTLHAGTEIKHLDFVQSNQMPELQLDLAYSGGDEAANHAVNSVQESLPIKKLVDSDYEAIYEQSLKAAAGGEISVAIEQLHSLIKQLPRYDKAREALVSLLIQDGQAVQANKILQTGLMLSPGYVPFVALQAKMLLDEGKYSTAYTLLKQIRPSINHYPEYYALLAAIYQHQGKPAQAAQLYLSLIKLQADQSKWWIGLGVALETQSKRSAALAAYMQAKKINNNLSPELQAYLDDKVSTL